MPGSARHNSPFVVARDYAYIPRVNWLTRQEQLVLCGILGLLLVGLAVKSYRTAHPHGPAVVENAAHATNQAVGPKSD